MRRTGLLVLLVVFNLVALLPLTTGIQQFRDAASSRHWPTVTGTVVSSKVVRTERTLTSGPTRRTPRYVYTADVRYEYSVDGKSMNGHRIVPSDFPSTTDAQARSIVARYPAGATVTVSFKPDDPGYAVLEPGESSDAVVLVLMGLGMIVVVTGGVIAVGGRDLVPPLVWHWLMLKLGRLDKDTAAAGPVTPPEAGPTDFREKMLEWRPGHRVVFGYRPMGMLKLLVLSITIAAPMGLVGGFLWGLYWHGQDVYISQYLPQMGIVFGAATVLLFGISCLQDRSRQTTMDWNARTLEIRRALQPTHRGSLEDISGVGITIVGVKGKRTRYYAAIDLELPGRPIDVARTATIRRKPESAREQGMTLATPLSQALGVALIERHG